MNLFRKREPPLLLKAAVCFTSLIRAEEDSLRGIFLRRLREKYDSAQAEERELIEQAARWGLAALDNMEEVVRHEDK